jgi:hypothetical protein
MLCTMQSVFIICVEPDLDQAQCIDVAYVEICPAGTLVRSRARQELNVYIRPGILSCAELFTVLHLATVERKNELITGQQPHSCGNSPLL